MNNQANNVTLTAFLRNIFHDGIQSLYFFPFVSSITLFFFFLSTATYENLGITSILPISDLVRPPILQRNPTMSPFEILSFFPLPIYNVHISGCTSGGSLSGISIISTDSLTYSGKNSFGPNRK